MGWKADGPQGNESAKIKWHVVPYVMGRGLDIGCGPWKVFPNVIGYDSHPSWRQIGVDVFGDARKLDLFADGCMDFVFSSHTLEDLEDTEATLKEWWRVIKPGGRLVLYLPHKDLYPNIGQPGANPAHKHDFHPDDIVAFMERVFPGWDLLENETRDQENEYSFYQVYRKRSDDEKDHFWKKRLGKKKLLVIRYGVIGDVVQAASVFPYLKKQGWEWLTILTNPQGKVTLQNNPHIDEFLAHDWSQTLPLTQRYVFDALSSRFDKSLNLTHIVENTLLVNERLHHWQSKTIHKIANHNYWEIIHEVAQVRLPPTPGFFPTEEEKAHALEVRRQIGSDKKVVFWSLAGSAPHKWWPYTMKAIKQLLRERKDVFVVTWGEDKWLDGIKTFKHKRFRHKTGEGGWSIRHALTFAEVADVVFGSETGVLSSVGMLRVPKVIWLSHSSEENLTKWWKNAFVIKPHSCECHPCHKLHPDKTCPLDPKTKASKCAASISIREVLDAIKKQLDWPLLADTHHKRGGKTNGKRTLPESKTGFSQRRPGLGSADLQGFAA